MKAGDARLVDDAVDRREGRSGGIVLPRVSGPVHLVKCQYTNVGHPNRVMTDRGSMSKQLANNVPTARTTPDDNHIPAAEHARVAVIHTMRDRLVHRKPVVLPVEGDVAREPVDALCSDKVVEVAMESGVANTILDREVPVARGRVTDPGCAVNDVLQTNVWREAEVRNCVLVVSQNVGARG